MGSAGGSGHCNLRHNENIQQKNPVNEHKEKINC